MRPVKNNGYFSFTKKERTGIMVMIFLIIILFLLPNFIPSNFSSPDEKTFASFKQELAKLEIRTSTDSMGNRMSYHATGKAADDNNKSLFYFDPNTINAAAWKNLGIKDRTILTIQRYISKGGRFRRADDLHKIYGIHEDEFSRLAPYVRIRNEGAANAEHKPYVRESKHDKSFPDSTRKSFSRKRDPTQAIDINAADTTSFIAFRGIGSKLAMRIVTFRDRLGGFYSVAQLAETYGLPDSVFQHIKPFLTVRLDAVNKIDINAADVNTLKKHPYIRWNLAKAIVAYRQQHGPFMNVADLERLNVLDAADLQKIVPYLKLASTTDKVQEK
jgi:competence protein ComEA